MGGSGRVVSTSAVSIRRALEARGVSLTLSLSDDADAGLRAMRGADVALVCGGASSTEMSDRPHLRLDQHDLLTRIAARATVPVVVAAIAPGSLVTSPWAGGASAVLAMFLAGQETGNAWADVLLGDVNPSGKLPVTFPTREEDTVPPCGASHCDYAEGLHSGWRGLIGKAVSFAFGHGLSYTEFEYAWDVPPQYEPHSGTVQLAVRLRNGGVVAGAEVVQLYVRFPRSAAEPELLLRDFAKTPLLAPGETVSLPFRLSTAQHLSVWRPSRTGAASASVDATDGGWQPVHGDFELSVGASSRDVRLRQSIAVGSA